MEPKILNSLPKKKIILEGDEVILCENFEQRRYFEFIDEAALLLKSEVIFENC